MVNADAIYLISTLSEAYCGKKIPRHQSHPELPQRPNKGSRLVMSVVPNEMPNKPYLWKKDSSVI